MLDFSEMRWEAIAILFVTLSGAGAFMILIVREYFESRQIRKGFKLTLARFSTWDWMRNIGKHKVKRLTYKDDPKD